MERVLHPEYCGVEGCNWKRHHSETIFVLCGMVLVWLLKKAWYPRQGRLSLCVPHEHQRRMLRFRGRRLGDMKERRRHGPRARYEMHRLELHIDKVLEREKARRRAEECEAAIP